jgi:hypothetical protein
VSVSAARNQGRRFFFEEPMARLNEEQWAEIESIWERAGATADDLADRFGVSRRAIFDRMKKRGIERGSKAEEVAGAIKDSLADEAVRRAGEIARRIEATKEEHYKFADQIAKLVMRELANAQRDGRPFATVDANIKTLQKAASTLATVRQERWTVLGIDNIQGDDEIPELHIEDLTQDQINDLQKQSDEDEDGELDDLGDLDLGDGVVEEG